MARSTLANLIQRVRELTGAGTAEYTLGTASYWSDDHVEGLLDRSRMDVWQEVLTPQLQQLDGLAQYRVYKSRYRDYEETSGGTAIFVLADSRGVAVGTANYTPEYARGFVTFGTSTGGSLYYLTGRSFDPYGAAAALLEGWAGYLARAIDFETANQSFKASQQPKGLLALAAQYRSQARSSGMSSEWERSDLSPPDADDAYLRYHRSTRG